jgi:hypothetical protein
MCNRFFWNRLYVDVEVISSAFYDFYEIYFVDQKMEYLETLT